MSAVEPGDLTITVEAGATLAEVQAALAPHGLFLPIDAPYPDRATIGGILAVNAFGASRLGYGTARDWLIGLTVVDAAGRLTKGGGKVVKNVTGYDLPKLHLGALGTLGILAEATFKVAPLPEAERTVLVRLGNDGIGGIGEWIRKVLNYTAPVRFYARKDNTGTYLVVQYCGFAEVVIAETEKCAAMAKSGFSRFHHKTIIGEPVTYETPTGNLVSQAVGSLETQWSAFYMPFDTHAVVETWFGTGVTQVTSPDSTPEALKAIRDVITFMATPDFSLINRLNILHAPLSVRTELAAWHPEPASLPLMRRIKNALDPGGVFNPGRFVGRL